MQRQAPQADQVRQTGAVIERRRRGVGSLRFEAQQPTIDAAGDGRGKRRHIGVRNARIQRVIRSASLTKRADGLQQLGQIRFSRDKPRSLNDIQHFVSD
ncbi:hypothetical protein C1X35_31555 [Pseudomonas sp. FW306-1C-G01A]|nr:hypothetical protein C1X39_32480 [Pseudomonas sp. GW456-12-1-14-TSB1]PMW54939.1 hypothetical protein C1X41_04375 [Pseudomonas sp. GW460-11-11-14-LB11]PMW73910.1 hypothetical protein C1X35_31555 [Pseudomonas sp. FW306-1C-G01A]PMX92893.1 hypothetical protein C1X43_32250 [Pseudomonas sp. GW460-C3]PMY35062.1 hypothetical protein C1X37_07325 [Pseudomonas sp. FW305-3-2-15-A-R2A1]PNA62884.1 hypothetical protein C1X34_06700 [Pseudomonas sp. GW456-12-10-14-TSB6]